jgi:hypothetical protein
VSLTAIRIQGDSQHSGKGEEWSRCGVTYHVALDFQVLAANLIYSQLAAISSLLFGDMDNRETVEDILSGFLESFGEESIGDDEQVRYGPLNLTIVRKVSDKLSGLRRNASTGLIAPKCI